MRELDVLLERFARERLAMAGGVDREAFARFLDLPDPLLADYLLRNAVPAEPEFARLVRSIIERAASGHNC
jgi:succinate dehydrogenase flavin-adding protein (antitoxin of CptAB toxin-antitoxin module)